MRLPPLSVEATWPVANYDNPVTRGPELYIVTSIFVFLTTLVVAVRLYARICVRRWFGLDDLFVIISYVSCIGFKGLSTNCIRFLPLALLVQLPLEWPTTTGIDTCGISH
jgi:hypothetical protein